MGYVFVIFGSLIALNLGLGVKMSEPHYGSWEDEASVEVETVEQVAPKRNDSP